jgi:Tfp pilus assembly protein PilE
MRKRLGTRGVTLVELMIAVAIITVGILGFVGSFKFITKALHISRARTLATNLGQEKVETLKNLSYYDLLITTATTSDNNFSPAVVYDNSNYPPESISVGGIQFTRYTFVALAQFVNDTVSTVTYTYPDTGMKQLTSTIVWNDAGKWKKWSLSNLLENPNVAPLDSNLTGTVNKATGGALASALVTLTGYPDQQTNADVNGTFSFHVYHGSYTVHVASTGYWDAESYTASATEGSTTQVLPNPILLTAIASGTITGNVWISSSILISQVMASSATCSGILAGACVPATVEYIEFYNPTLNEFSIEDAGMVNSYVQLLYGGSALAKDANTFPINVMVSTYMASGHYYLLANASNFMLNGQWVHADAAYTGTILGNDLGGCGSLQINSALNGAYITTLDQVGWNGPTCGAGRPAYSNGTIIPTASGLTAGNQLVRVSSPAASVTNIRQWGRAYNSGGNFYRSGIGGNNLDFVYQDISGYDGINFQPYHENTLDVGYTTAPIVTGIPALRSYVSVSDPFSASTFSLTSFVSSGALSLPYSPFKLVSVTTSIAPVAASCAGLCWAVDIATNGYAAMISTVVVTQNVSTGIPNASTSVSWPTSSQNSVILNLSTGGYVEGNVTDINGVSINGASLGISINVGGVATTLSSDGDYFVKTSTGFVTVIANATSVSPYVQVIAMPYVNTGQITTQNFILSQGGSIVGLCQNSSGNAIPNYTFVATQGGAEMGSGTSNSSGFFYIKNLSTGTYTVKPALEAGRSSNPTSTNVTISTTGAYSAGTFIIAGAMGTIYGTVKLNNALVTTGALILASSTAWTVAGANSVLTAGPPTIVGSSAPAMSPLYAVSSLADGSYSLSVRGGYSYYMLVYIPAVGVDGRVTVSTGTPGTQAGVGAGKTAQYNISQ